MFFSYIYYILLLIKVIQQITDYKNITLLHIRTPKEG